MAHAVLVVDMLNDFILPGAPLEVPGGREIIPAVKREIDAARERGELVIHACDAHDPDDKEFDRYPPHAVAGTPGAAIVDELAPLPGEQVVHKRRLSPFFQTDLHLILERAGVDKVTVVGVCTHICVMEAVAGLCNHDIAARVPRDAVADFDPELAQAAFKRMAGVLGADIVPA